MRISPYKTKTKTTKRFSKDKTQKDLFFFTLVMNMGKRYVILFMKYRVEHIKVSWGRSNM